MKRMVTYIYLYKKNNNILSKCENMGFCRVWQNGDRYIVNLCLKDSCGVKGTFYISILKKSEKDGRVVYCKNDIDICRTVVGGTINIKLEVEENDGIYMECGGRIYVTLWNESMKDIEIVENVENKRKKIYVKDEEKTRKSLYVENVEETRENSCAESVEKKRESSYVESVEKTRENSYAESVENIREYSCTEYVKNENNKKIKNAELRNDNNIKSTHKKKDDKISNKEDITQNKDSRKIELEQYARIYNRLCKVRMILNEKEYPAVKLKLHELMLLPRTCWRMANNIFLMESYYMYGNIFFMQYGGKYILAVPGQNKRGTEVMAKQCGFLEHVTGYEYGRKRESKIYWIKEL